MFESKGSRLTEQGQENRVDIIDYHYEPIGFVRSPYRDRFGVPRQPGLAPAARAFLELAPKWQPESSLEGLSEFSHLWVIFDFHRNSPSRFHAKVHPPRMGGASSGVFATRSPHRPNPIGLSLLKIVEVTPKGVWVSGSDLVDGTPILDIKPYLPEVESQVEARGGWTTDRTNSKETVPPLVKWSEEAKFALVSWQNKHSQYDLRCLIEESILLDPRPLVYRDGEQFEHAMRILDGDVHFCWEPYGSGGGYGDGAEEIDGCTGSGPQGNWLVTRVLL